jgi:hypothetical protein
MYRSTAQQSAQHDTDFLRGFLYFSDFAPMGAGIASPRRGSAVQS